MNIDIDLGRAFSFIFDDEQWIRRILIGGLLLLIPLLGIFWLLGYMIDVARNVMHDNPHPLPAIQFGDQLGKGLYVFLISLVYAIPILILICITMGLIALTAGVTGGEDGAMAGVTIFTMFCLYPLIFLVSLAIQMFVFAGYVRYIQTDSVSEALNFARIWGMVRSSLKTWAIVLLIYLLASIIGSAGLVAAGIGVIFTMVFGQAFFGHILGQVAAQMPDERMTVASAY